jgi:hypothetical protein
MSCLRSSRSPTRLCRSRGGLDALARAAVVGTPLHAGRRPGATYAVRGKAEELRSSMPRTLMSWLPERCWRRVVAAAASISRRTNRFDWRSRPSSIPCRRYRSRRRRGPRCPDRTRPSRRPVASPSRFPELHAGEDENVEEGGGGTVAHLQRGGAGDAVAGHLVGHVSLPSRVRFAAPPSRPDRRAGWEKRRPRLCERPVRRRFLPWTAPSPGSRRIAGIEPSPRR